MTESPEEGDYIKLTFDDPERGYEKDPLTGRVIEVNHDPSAAADIEIGVDNGEKARTIWYREGVYEGEGFAWVERLSEFGGSYHIGENAEWELLQ